MLRVMRELLAAIACAIVACPGSVRAELPSTGWPQERRDAARTGRSEENALVNPVVAWSTRLGPSLAGEPVADGCSVFVGDGAGDIIALDAIDGTQAWRVPRPPAPCAAGLPSRLALDDAGRLLAGWPGGADLAEAARSACDVLSGIGSYAIDNNEYPPDSDVIAAISPWYVTPPVNACTGAPLRQSDVPSPGDIRYVRVSQDEFQFGLWWTDGGLIPGIAACGSWPGERGAMPPGWPRSAAITPGRALSRADGIELWRLAEGPITADSVPSVLADGVAWAETGLLPHLPDGHVGRLAVTDAAGAGLWMRALQGGAAGGVARDAASGLTVIAHRRADLGPLWRTLVQVVATAIESHAIDNNAHPPTGDLEAALRPAHVREMPVNPFTGATARWSDTPSPGDYFYEQGPTPEEYRIWWWTARGAPHAEMRTGAFVDVVPVPDEAALVQAIGASGPAWWFDAVLDPSPPALHADGSLVFTTADGILHARDVATGAPRWTLALGGQAPQPPALLPDGGIVLIVDGRVACVDPPGILRWTSPAGPRHVAGVTTTADGFTLAGDEAGTLRAISASGAEAWARALGPDPIATPPIVADGRIFVGLADGVLLALQERDRLRLAPITRGLHVSVADAPGAVRLSWPDVEIAAVPGAHHHVWRHRGGPLAPATPVHAGHDLVAREIVDPDPGSGLVTYTLMAADACEHEPGP